MMKFLTPDQSPVKEVDEPNVRKIGNYSFNVRFCLGEGSYGTTYNINMYQVRYSMEKILRITQKQQSNRLKLNSLNSMISTLNSK